MSEYPNDYIAQLAKKLLSGTISDKENAILEKWYKERPEHPPVWQLNNESKQELEDRLLNQIRQQTRIVKWRMPVWSKLAAAAVIFVALSCSLYIFLSHQKSDNQHFSIAGTAGNIKKILLPDQSIVWLKGNSRLDFPAVFSDSTRNVVLHGEALFEVSKDKKHPFIITAGHYLTRVVGTSFNIKEDQRTQSFNLTVLTGKVLVSKLKDHNTASAAENTLLVTPGKEFRSASLLSASSVTMAQPLAKEAVVKGTEYLMNFENSGFANIKSHIEHKFDVSINTQDNIYSKCELSADVTDQSLENTLKIICSAIGAQYTIVNKKITITGGGCN